MMSAHAHDERTPERFRRPPKPRSAWAYFVDFDGTLVSFAPTPGAVQVDADVKAMIARVSQLSGGALAIISGRAIADVDAMMGTSKLPMAGLHGLERRRADGTHLRPPSEGASLEAVRSFLRTALRGRTQLLLEDKGVSLALHYRVAPTLSHYAQRIMRLALARADGAYRLQTGKCVVELLPAHANKGDAIRAFMNEPPFSGRVPVFIGDDDTDESAFVEVNTMKGVSVKVGGGNTMAYWSLPDVASVREWLHTLDTPHVVHNTILRRHHADA